MRWFLLTIAIALSSAGIVISDDGGHQAAPRVQATIYSTDRCIPCRRYIDAVKKEMPPDGWIVREASDKDAGTAHVIVTKATPADGIGSFPTTIIRRDGREVDRIVGQVTPTELAERINKQAK